MEVIQILRESFTLREIGKGVLIVVIFSQVLTPSKIDESNRRKPTWKAEAIISGGFFSLYLLARAWLALVDHYVPEPYLDEVFHIPQAQTYCKGHYFDWDDKITTPPGLYFLSVLYHKLWLVPTCTAFSLRGINLIAILQIGLLCCICRNTIEARSNPRNPQAFSLYTVHTAINIALFPALFFFSALYYTDVVSTLVTLAAYQVHLGRMTGELSVKSAVLMLLLGVGALGMRQTNVFWVVVWMGGCEAVHAVRSLKPEKVQRPRFETVGDTVKWYAWRYSLGEVHDPPLGTTWPDDWLLCVVSLGIAAVCNPVRVVRQIWPHVTVLGLFGAFVIWNGGVVLGDKSNHIATIHLSQMQYTWPLFAFFSAPLLIPVLLQWVYAILYTNPLLSWAWHRRLYYPLYILGTILLSLAVVHFNTIIHPFTLADNRHYMFYVFRYTILRPSITRYVLVGAYTLSRWLVWHRLAGCSAAEQLTADTALINSPFSSQDTTVAPAKRPENPTPPTKRLPSPASLPAYTLGPLTEPISTSSHPPSASTALLWLLTTSLSLITAPLVEPRYFILPWVFWRLLVPAWPSPFPSPSPSQREKEGYLSTIPVVMRVLAIGREVDLSLLCETLWFLAVNVGTMYMFLMRPYVWSSSEGEILDGGRLQRFMW